jgi:hypothetical protein
LIAVLLWVYYSAQIFLLGAEIYKGLRELPQTLGLSLQISRAVLVLALQVANLRSALFDLSFIHLFRDAPGLRFRGMGRGQWLPRVSTLHDEPYVYGGCRRHRNEEPAGP